MELAIEQAFGDAPNAVVEGLTTATTGGSPDDAIEIEYLDVPSEVIRPEDMDVDDVVGERVDGVVSAADFVLLEAEVESGRGESPGSTVSSVSSVTHSSARWSDDVAEDGPPHPEDPLQVAGSDISKGKGVATGAKTRRGKGRRY